VTTKGAGTTYKLELERGASGQITVVTTKGGGMTYSLEVERGGMRSDHSCDCKGLGMKYSLERKSGGKRSDHGCDCKWSRGDIQSGGAEGGQVVRSWLQLQREQGQHTAWRWRGKARGQITVAMTKGARMMYFLEVERGASGQNMVVTAKGAGMTYSLEVERGGKRSDHGCDCRGTKDDIQTGGGEGGQEVRSQL
jgi:hypothetical protein